MRSGAVHERPERVSHQLVDQSAAGVLVVPVDRGLANRSVVVAGERGVEAVVLQRQSEGDLPPDVAAPVNRLGVACPLETA